MRLLAGMRVASLIAGVLVLSIGAPKQPAEGQTAERASNPNFIVINTDDLDKTSMKYMKGIERQVTVQGTKFTNAHVSVPACCPSRATFFTGQYVHNHGVYYQNSRLIHQKHLGAHDAFKANAHEDTNLATRMDAAGYETSLVGKYMNNYDDEYVPQGWDDWHAWMGAGGGLGGTMNENGTVVDHGDWTRENRDHAEIEADRAVDFVKSSQGKPFMLVIPTKVPHAPSIPLERHRGKLLNAKLPTNGSYNEKYIRDKPRWIRNNPRLTEQDEKRFQFLFRKRLQSMLAVQEMVRRLTDELREQGELGNTYIMFTSDNGFHLGQHRMRNGKFSPYQEDIEVPLIVRGPGVERDVNRRHLASHTDIAPTILDLAGAESLPEADGRSLKPILEGERTPSRRNVLIEQWKDAGSGDRQGPTWKAVRTLRGYKYVEYVTGEKELYNLNRDPNEGSNLAGERPRLERRLDRKLSELKNCSADECRAAEN